ncbi:MAG TPA: aldehyde dehydrogenase family protein [Steroidobacteraceae bacterium]|nr:aldehyde dehydrogenase family protein [Steroidobacteraceae bacterium]
MKTLQHYIDGRFVAPVTGAGRFSVINPATEAPVAEILMGSSADIDAAVAAAVRAFPTFAALPLSERIAMLERLLAVYERRYADMVEAITTEMGAPHDLSKRSQAAAGRGHIQEAINAARSLDWEVRTRGAAVMREPVGVCGLITPWNWPLNQIGAKVAPALAAGCTVVLKPSEQAPLSAQLFAEFMDEARFPTGVFNMVHGTGPVVGHALAGHPDVDMMSFTGSTRAGISVAKTAADTVKRVAQELGGKSPNLVFADADLEAAVKRGVLHCFNNSGQSCNAPTRMLVEDSVYDRAVEIAVATGAAVEVGDPSKPGKHLGPVASRMQFEKIGRCIEQGIAEGARLVLGGPGRPPGLDVGYYVRPTIFADVDNRMSIARDEIFGPVLSMMRFRTLDEAIAIANDTPYGLAAYVQTQDLDKARRVARRLRAGSVHLNGAAQDYDAPFGGFKQSGNGREFGSYGLGEFLEFKSINGYYAA